MAWSVRCALLFNRNRYASIVRVFCSEEWTYVPENYNGNNILLEVLSDNKYACHGPRILHPLTY
jgi:hypothetical protein